MAIPIKLWTCLYLASNVLSQTALPKCYCTFVIRLAGFTSARGTLTGRTPDDQ